MARKTTGILGSMGKKLGRKFWPVSSRNTCVHPPFLPFLPNTPACTAPTREFFDMRDPMGKKGRKTIKGEDDNEKRNHNHRPGGRTRRPHQHAMPAVQTLQAVSVPAVPTVPVPTAAPVAAMASMAMASAVAADAGLVLTRTIAPRRVRTTGRLPARGARKRAKYREIRPFLPQSGGGHGAMGAGRPPLGRVLPSTPSQGRRPEGVALWGRVGFRGRTFFSSHFHGEGDTCRSP
jgi:hypothetical protein